MVITTKNFDNAMETYRIRDQLTRPGKSFDRRCTFKPVEDGLVQMFDRQGKNVCGILDPVSYYDALKSSDVSKMFSYENRN
jgi:hypothetical protein